MSLRTSSAERLRIDSSGNVGIGTTSPEAKLTISDTTTAGTDPTDPTHATISLKYNSTKILNIGDYGTTPFASYIHSTNTSGSSFSLALNPSGGNVGIGTSSPTTFGGYLTVHQKNSSGDAIHLIESDGGIIAQTVVNDGTAAVTTGSRSNHAWRVTTNDTERMRIDTSGNISAGTTSVFNGARLSLNQSGSNPALACRTSTSSGTVPVVIFLDGDSTDCGSIDVNTTANTTAYTTSSDQRLKENIVDAPAGNIDDVRVRSFNWKSSGYHQTYGLIAQELFDVAPEAVSKGKTEEDTWKVDYSKLVPMMIKEIQDLKAEVAALKQK
jgi:hypothetical protein